LWQLLKRNAGWDSPSIVTFDRFVNVATGRTFMAIEIARIDRLY
jgi:hypothetical protein